MEPLTDEQVRVLGCLLEKEATVPDVYPMTLNALRQACNQSSSRYPIVDYDEATVQRCLDELKATGYVRFVHPSHGARTTKFRHVAGDQLGLDATELAVLGVLSLRGPQTSGELRTRTERWCHFDSVGDVDAVLASLSARDQPLTAELPRQPGQHQTRWAHLLCGPVDESELSAAAAPVAAAPAAAPAPVADDRVAALSETVAALQARIDRLERELGLDEF